MKAKVIELVKSFFALFRTDSRWHSFEGTVFLDSGEDPNPPLNRRQLVIIGTPERPKWLKFRCPCTCGGAIALNLMKSHYPHWTIDLHFDHTLSVSPSIDSTSCGSHFWIRKSKIRWVDESFRTAS